jgi:RNA polymerase sigma-70 factor (family 1)
MPEHLPYDIKTLLLAVGQGSEVAFRDVFHFYKHRFYSTSLKMTRSAVIAEDVVQEVFVTIWVKRLQVAAANDPEAYVLSILHHSIYAHFRRLALEKNLLRNIVQQVDLAAISPVEEVLLAKESREILESVISRLPYRQRMVYKLSRQDGLSREQIARQMHISPHTVKNHLQQAMLFIRASFNAGASAFAGLIAWLFS